MKTTRTFFLIAAMASLFACSKKAAVKPQTALPTPTQNGSNTVAWTTAGENYVSNSYAGTVLYDNPGTGSGYFVMAASPATGTSYTRDIYLTTPAGTPMPIQLNQPYTTSGGSSLDEKLNAAGSQSVQLLVTNGTITITHFDPANLVISGTFNFSTSTFNQSGVLARPTSGWFDLHYRLYTTDPNLFVGVAKTSPVPALHSGN